MLAEGSAPCLVPEEEAAILFLNADDRVLLLVNGAIAIEKRYGQNTAVDGFPENAPALGVSNGRARFKDIEVLRDVHYSEYGCRCGVGEPYAVPEGEFFLLGDNSSNSRDSRHFGSVPKSCFAGRPFLIFRPASRFRFL
ncbi:MAG: S26 family signal peptidase [Planctomycetes bacterium]|nr:S26 family signal peptidase [Planctomycetota bacterium]